MRSVPALIAITLALFLIAGEPALAQTASQDSALLNNRAVRKLDREECTTQAQRQNVAKRNLAEFVRKCMAERQGERKAAAKKGAELQNKKGMAAEEWAAIVEVRNRERRQALEQQTAKRADCNKQADDQKLRLKERRLFIKKCVS